jgi:hypothetical protein
MNGGNFTQRRKVKKKRRKEKKFLFAPLRLSLRLCVKPFLRMYRRAGVFDVTPDPPRDEECARNTNQKIEAVKPRL